MKVLCHCEQQLDLLESLMFIRLYAGFLVRFKAWMQSPVACFTIIIVKQATGDIILLLTFPTGTCITVINIWYLILQSCL